MVVYDLARDAAGGPTEPKALVGAGHDAEVVASPPLAAIARGFARASGVNVAA